MTLILPLFAAHGFGDLTILPPKEVATFWVTYFDAETVNRDGEGDCIYRNFYRIKMGALLCCAYCFAVHFPCLHFSNVDVSFVYLSLCTADPDAEFHFDPDRVPVLTGAGRLYLFSLRPVICDQRTDSRQGATATSFSFHWNACVLTCFVCFVVLV